MADSDSLTLPTANQLVRRSKLKFTIAHRPAVSLLFRYVCTTPVKPHGWPSGPSPTRNILAWMRWKCRNHFTRSPGSLVSMLHCKQTQHPRSVYTRRTAAAILRAIPLSPKQHGCFTDLLFGLNTWVMD
nr:uncharacterized protein CTRU02_06511 [Colletotrichum truncatum]KAF6792429.1 hypothetical protein CTRU02_06511 [Colletotrichum truncatum]